MTEPRLHARTQVPLGILVKSYREDFSLAERLMESLDQHNVEALPIWIVVPDEDIDLFSRFTSKTTELLPESVFADQLTDQPLGGIRPGYINQEVIKLAFSGLGLANNYLPIDSDAVILRPFGAKDLMFDDQTPFSILVEDNDLKVDPAYYEQNWIGRSQSLAKIAEILDFQDLRMLTCHGHQILSTRVIESLNEDFLAPKGWTYLDMLAESPYEFSWYNFWLQKSRPIRIEIREPLFKVVHSASQHVELALRHISPDDIARGYLGFVINSNFSKSWGPISPNEPAELTLARYLGWGLLLRTLSRKFTLSIRTRLRTRK
jgi:hypothetical protein